MTASVQFAGGIVIFFGLLVSPEEIGEEKPSLPFKIACCCEPREVQGQELGFSEEGCAAHSSQGTKEQFCPVHPVQLQPGLLPLLVFEGSEAHI